MDVDVGRGRDPAEARRVLSAGASIVAVLVILVPAPAAAQTDCHLLESNFARSLELGGGNRITYISGPLEIGCDDGTRILADSAQTHTETNFTQLFGNVFFEDAQKRMTSARAQYFEREGRLLAWGTVELTDIVNHSVLYGDSLRFLRAGERRAEDFLTMTGRRARGILHPERSGDPDPTAGEPEPYEVEGDRIEIEGDRIFRAIGRAEIRRDGMLALADSAVQDRVEETFLLLGTASIEGESYQLSGRRILLNTPDDQLRDIVASEDAVLTAEGLDFSAPEIRVYLTEGQMERLIGVAMVSDGDQPDIERPGVGEPGERPQRDSEGVAGAVPPRVTDVREGQRLRPVDDADAAVRPREGEAAPRPERAAAAARGQARALTDDFLLRGDSIEVLAPGEVLQRVFSAGRAYGERLGQDTLDVEGLPQIARRDWIDGDTIIALFRPDLRGDAEPDDAADPEEEVRSGDRYQVERIIARVDARSLYRFEASETPADGAHARSAIHYVTGTEITIYLREDGEVDRMEVEGPTRGVHLEPVVRRVETPADAPPPAVREREGR